MYNDSTELKMIDHLNKLSDIVNVEGLNKSLGVSKRTLSKLKSGTQGASWDLRRKGQNIIVVHILERIIDAVGDLDEFKKLVNEITVNYEKEKSKTKAKGVKKLID